MRTSADRVAGHPEPTPLIQYADAVTGYRLVLAGLVEATDRLAASVGGDPIEFRELLRTSLRIEAGRAIEATEHDAPPQRG